jgi:hypothetical protein
MSAPFPPPAVDYLSQAIAIVRAELDPALPVTKRLRTLWAGVVAARDLGASDVVETEFLELARECGLYRALGRHAATDLQHVIRWAMLGRDPFGN